jgi:hypothetical protein
MSCKKNIVKGIGFKDTNVRLNILTIHFSQIAKANGFLQPNVQNFPIFFYCSTLSILKCFFEEK